MTDKSDTTNPSKTAPAPTSAKSLRSLISDAENNLHEARYLAQAIRCMSLTGIKDGLDQPDCEGLDAVAGHLISTLETAFAEWQATHDAAVALGNQKAA